MPRIEAEDVCRWLPIWRFANEVEVVVKGDGSEYSPLLTGKGRFDWSHLEWTDAPKPSKFDVASPYGVVESFWGRLKTVRLACLRHEPGESIYPPVEDRPVSVLTFALD